MWRPTLMSPASSVWRRKCCSHSSRQCNAAQVSVGDAFELLQVAADRVQCPAIVLIRPRGRPLTLGGYDRSATFLTGGIVQVPSMIDGLLSFGQYIRSMRMNLPAGAGSQFASLSAPGESFWM